MTKDEQIGYDLGLQGLRYTQLPNAVGGSVNAAIYRGFDKAMSITKCGFSDKPWNLNFSYKPSYDLRPWFT